MLYALRTHQSPAVTRFRVGYSKDAATLATRKRTHQSSVPWDLLTVWTRDGDQADEKRLHSFLSPLNCRRGPRSRSVYWGNGSDGLLRFFQRLDDEEWRAMNTLQSQDVWLLVK